LRIPRKCFASFLLPSWDHQNDLLEFVPAVYGERQKGIFCLICLLSSVVLFPILEKDPSRIVLAFRHLGFLAIRGAAKDNPNCFKAKGGSESGFPARHDLAIPVEDHPFFIGALGVDPSFGVFALLIDMEEGTAIVEVVSVAKQTFSLEIDGVEEPIYAIQAKMYLPANK
jgi:hypothetical protein